MAAEQALQATVGPDEFAERFSALHRQLWATCEYRFNDVTEHVFRPPAGYYQVDHSFIHDGKQWHLYYVTGEMRLSEPWIRCRAAGDIDGAAAVCVEPGNGHAAGPSLFDLRFIENVFHPSQGRFDLMSRGVCSLFRFRGRYGMLYDVRGDRGDRMSLAWSDDLYRWELDSRNPVLAAPAWANPHGSFKDPHVMEWRGSYLIYVVAWDKTGHPCVALLTTEDWVHFDDHGPVFSTTPWMRGTFGLESPQVIHRNGIWHLFYTHGPGLWHAIAPSPAGFMEGAGASATRVSRGAYVIGPFHATEIVEDGNRWWLTTDRKEETRRLNREEGRMCYRGSYEDERTLEEGLYLSQVIWKGDQPTLARPARP